MHGSATVPARELSGLRTPCKAVQGPRSWRLSTSYTTDTPGAALASLFSTLKRDASGASGLEALAGITDCSPRRSRSFASGASLPNAPWQLVVAFQPEARSAEFRSLDVLVQAKEQGGRFWRRPGCLARAAMARTRQLTSSCRPSNLPPATQSEAERLKSDQSAIIRANFSAKLHAAKLNCLGTSRLWPSQTRPEPGTHKRSAPPTPRQLRKSVGP